MTRRLREARSGKISLTGGVRCLFLVYADDLLCLLAHEHLPTLILAEWENAEDALQTLEDLGLSSAADKSESLLIPPGDMVGDLFRRQAHLTRRGHYEVKKRDDQLARLRMEDKEQEGDACKEQETGRSANCWDNSAALEAEKVTPFRRVCQLRILGLTLDERFSFQEHFAQIINRAKIRMGIATRLSGIAWGLETNVLRMTSNSLITSLLTYGLAVTGSMAYEQLLSKVDAAIINVTARKILGVGASARIPALHLTAGVKSIHNLYLQHCAELLDSSLRVTNGTIQKRMRLWVDGIYGTKQWIPSIIRLDDPQSYINSDFSIKT